MPARKGQKFKHYTEELKKEAIRLHVEEGWTYRPTHSPEFSTTQFSPSLMIMFFALSISASLRPFLWYDLSFQPPMRKVITPAPTVNIVIIEPYDSTHKLE
ncbi:hypothetical protein P4H65_04825 [Paenibacillus chitinolyticus]|uniref:hypothetical protein n=1 Tax=Paenibacillus chitinolyticus TaxID=79263 RepID=UPI002DBF84C5|nr:hypothetical protein [Paenibacillus chitinolyticus]MEC0245114.1 hypothetical protein [Paenibacillus chitinolyticus]